ncbi:MAG: aspartate aminotransferase family protein [Chloroflexi bacterium HGW-Chloroflexi-1]|nr:MAG: aspartate aminotransferase family protein [Chloroflexi bacterium HGW-Chloroflexi-1]
MYDKNWAKVDLDNVPRMVTPAPGPKSHEMHARAAQYMKGYSSQVRLFPVVFESGHGCTLTDVDGNVYIDFSSGIYVTGLGHCHPKVTEAVQRAAGELMNAHDYTTPIKMRLLEKLADITMGEGRKKLSGMQLYDSGTTAVEAGLRLMRAATGKSEFISFHRDFHGKTMGAVGLARLDASQGLRAPGFFLAPRGYCYRCEFRQKYPDCDLLCVDYLRTIIREETAGRVAGIVLEPIQGWAGSVVPPDGWIRKIRALCDEYGILLMADEVLTCMARTGKMFAMQHWDTVPDVMTLGKGFGNGFPVTAMLVADQYKEVIEKISASTSYGGNPMACAAALASIEVIEEERLCERSAHLGEILLARMKQLEASSPIVGEARGLGCLLGLELVKDKATKEPFDLAGQLVYQKAFRKGLAWIPAGHILRMSPPLIMDDDLAMKALDIIEESIYETQRELG